MKVALRLARREVLRRPGRSLLVALLVALPVAGMAMSMVLIRSDHRTLDEEWQGFAGQADATVYVGAPNEEGYTPPPVLPPGSRSIDVRQAGTSLRTADHLHRASWIPTSDVPLADPLAAGIFDLVEGRAPSTGAEVAVSRSVLDDLGASVGDAVTLDRPVETTIEIVGRIEQAGCLSCDQLVTVPGLFGEALEGGSSSQRLVDLPDDLPAAQLEALGRSEGVQLRAHYGEGIGQGDDGGVEEIRWTLVIGAVVLTVMGIVISAAFAVGARRQLVALGQLSASGASPRLLRASLVLQGTVTGAVGALVGLVLGLAAVFAFHRPLERLLDRRIDDLPIRATDLLAAVAVGVGAATLAALIPARSAAKVSTLSALAGRRPQSKVPARMIAFGTAAVIGGLALQGLAVLGGRDRGGDVWAAVAIVGGVAELLGACAIAPLVVARLEPFAGRMRGSWRLGARSLARSRTRTGAVVSAVAATGALAVLAVGMVRGYEARDMDRLEASDRVVVSTVEVDRWVDPTQDRWELSRELPPAEVQAELTELLPDAEVSVVRGVSLLGHPRAPQGPESAIGPKGVDDFWSLDDPADGGSFQGYVIDGAAIADVAVYEATGVDADGRAALEEAGMGLLTKQGGRPPVLRSPDGEEIALARVDADHSLGLGGPLLLVTEAKAAELGLVVSDAALLMQNPVALTADERERLDDVWADYQTDTWMVSQEDQSRWLYLGFDHPDRGPSPLQIELILSGVALVFALFVVGVSLGLAAAESKDERDVLTVAGAPPGALARSAGARAVLLSVLGAAMAVPVGFLPVLVYAQADDDGFRVVFPGTTVALLLVAVPLVVGAVALLSSAMAQRLRPVRVSTATWD